MRLQYYPADKLKKEILSIVSEHLDLTKYKVFFFGSRVEGRGTERSDIDIGIEGPKPVPAVSLSKMEEKIEQIPTLYKIELVDFNHVSEKFKKVAMQKIEMIN